MVVAAGVAGDEKFFGDGAWCAFEAAGEGIGRF
ncbi:MAG: hypothetical protein QOI79_4435, partial [Mycobacterium sp.]|nr:hypothetical protein [Mycobacterium sp.]